MSKLNLTVTELHALLEGLSSDQLRGYAQIKTYIDGKTQADTDALKKLIAENKQELQDSLDIDSAALEAFKAIADGWDGESEGEYNIGALVTKTISETKINEQSITANTQAIDGLIARLNKEVSDRVAQGTSLNDAIALVKADLSNMISTFEASLNGALERIVALETELAKVSNILESGFRKLAFEANKTADAVVAMYGGSVDSDAPVH